MKTVLIIGGYGQFGGRLSRRLRKTPELKVLVGGRTMSKAAALCEIYKGNLEPVLFDSKGDLDTQLKTLSPWLVVDAAGPFQAKFRAGYGLAKACITRGIHYIDLSDSGPFTQGIADLDAAAKQTNAAVISGASSVPALSSAVVDAAQNQFSQIDSIEGGISPGGKIDIGLSVTQAVLSYLGRPLKIFRGGVWESETGYSRVHKHTIALEGEKPLRRWFGLCEAPDEILFPDHYKGVQTVRFYGSQELWVIHQSIVILAWLQKRGFVKNLDKRAKFFAWWGTQLGKFASERGGMFMMIKGKDKAGADISQQWNLIASEGDGPFIPILAAEILISRWMNAAPTSGARSAVSEITLAEFEAMFKSLAIKSEFAAPRPALPVFRQVLGESYAALPAALQTGHEVTSYKTMTGRVDITRGKNPLTHLAANIIGFAKAQKDAPISVTMDVRGNTEIWTRTIGTTNFKSVLSPGSSPYEVFEKFGPVKFKMLFRVDDNKLHYDIIGACMFGMPLPKFLRPKSVTHEREENGKFIFDVDTALPLLGRLIAYKGWLE